MKYQSIVSGFLIGAMLGVAPLSAEDTTPVHFPDQECGLRFVFDSGWRVSVRYLQPAGCAPELKPPPDHEYVSASPSRPDEPCRFGTVSIEVRPESFDALAKRKRLVYKDGQWYDRLVDPLFLAEFVQARGWSGAHTSVTSHICGTAHSSHRWVLGHSSRSLVIDTTDNDDFVKGLLGSLLILK